VAALTPATAPESFPVVFPYLLVAEIGYLREREVKYRERKGGLKWRVGPVS
jgi:hypothetical protein